MAAHSKPDQGRAAWSTRLITGALSSIAICITAGRPWVIGMAAGAIGAISGAFAGYHARRVLTKRWLIPDLVVAFAEDFVTIAGTLLLFAALFLKR